MWKILGNKKQTVVALSKAKLNSQPRDPVAMKWATTSCPIFCFPLLPGQQRKAPHTARQSHAALRHPCKTEPALITALARLVRGCCEPRSRFLVKMKAQVNQGQKAAHRTKGSEQDRGARGSSLCCCKRERSEGKNRKANKQAACNCLKWNSRIEFW